MTPSLDYRAQHKQLHTPMVLVFPAVCQHTLIVLISAKMSLIPLIFSLQTRLLHSSAFTQKVNESEKFPSPCYTNPSVTWPHYKTQPWSVMHIFLRWCLLNKLCVISLITWPVGKVMPATHVIYPASCSCEVGFNFFYIRCFWSVFIFVCAIHQQPVV